MCAPRGPRGAETQVSRAGVNLRHPQKEAELHVSTQKWLPAIQDGAFARNQAGLGLVREVGRGSQGRGEQRESHEARWPGLGWGWG